jgi:glucose-fructose oxidoreductase
MKPELRPSLSRRRFVSHLAVGAATLALARHSRGQTAPAKKLGIALCGLGQYARGQLGPALKLTQHCRLAGVITGSREKGVQWAKDHGFPEKNIYHYDTMQQMAANPDIDIVYVVTPNALHAPHTIAAAKAGKHVICEKPMGMNAAECDKMIAACKAANVRLSIGYRLHFEPHTQELKRLAKDKDFGALMKMSGGNGFRMERKVWRADHKLSGGGPLMDMGIYSVQAACMAAGDATCVAVTAKEHPKTRPEIFADVEEGLNYTLEFSNGAKAELMTTYAERIGKFRAEGEKGWISLEPAHSYQGIKAVTSKGPVDVRPIASQQALQMDDFALCVREQRESIVGGAMGRRDMRIVDAIYEAAKTGKRTLVKA